jgi:DNA-binding MarR family transcriptional regulator
MHGESPELPENEQVNVSLTGRDLDDLQRLLGLLIEASIQGGRMSKTRSGPAQASLLAQAKLILESRKRRIDYFGRGVFGEPAWEILLLLYVTAGGQRQTVPRLSKLSGISRSTAIRWIEYLERERLVSRAPHPTDRRIDFVQLTESGRERLEAYLSEAIA